MTFQSLPAESPLSISCRANWLACIRASLLSLLFAANAAVCQTDDTFKPSEGQEGKDVVWVPTPPALVEKMLDMAQVRPEDFVMDLGSGDGRNIIAAAKRGARAVGVEYNPDMVALSQRIAAEAGVADKAQFVQGDMFEADISRATVLALFLLPDNLRKLTAKFLDLRPGTRIVANTFGIAGWDPDETGRTEGDCYAWCTSLLYIVPAKVAGTWNLEGATLVLEQDHQKLSGTLIQGNSRQTIEKGRVAGDRISFTAGGIEYSARADGDALNGDARGGAMVRWNAIRARKP